MDLPKALLDPPWKRKPAAAPSSEDEPILVPGLTAPDDRAILWEPGERERWAEVRPYGSWRDGEWEEAAEKFRDGRMSYEPTRAGFLAQAPEHLARPLLAGWEPHVTWDFDHSLQPIVARFETDAWDVAFRLAKQNAFGTGPILRPFLSADVARLFADWLYRLTSAQKIAHTWFGRHGLAAVPYLVPDALGKRVGPRRNAIKALRTIEGDVVGAARVHGDEAADAVAKLLVAAPPDNAPVQPPIRPPSLPTWLDVDALPRPALRDGGELPREACRHLLLAMVGTPGGRVDVSEVVDGAAGVCDPESLTAFAWALFEAWQAARLPKRSGFVLATLGRFGDDGTVRRLTPLVKDWPGQSGGYSRAVQGLDVLVEIGSDTALTQLNGIAQKSRYKGLQGEAQRKLLAIAQRRGLTGDQLADRLVPGLGLDADGTLTLDYGPRRFTVGFDEQLKPSVSDENGKPRKSLPKPGAKDDPDLAPAAYKRFAELKKDVRAVASGEVARLESSMVMGREWTRAEFAEFVAGHPLLRHLARRLVWLSGGRPFRIAEDRTFADLDDDAVELPVSANVQIAHPLDLGDSLTAWAEVFADYEILQPFPQLGRPVLTLADGEGRNGRLERFEGLTVPTGKLLGLTRTSWTRGPAQDNGIEHWISWHLAPDVTVVIDLRPGIAVGLVDLNPVQTTERVWIGKSPYSAVMENGLDGVNPVFVSELLADLTSLTPP
ncbi:DUF4132 domain-containing protein [Actinomadura darangshiensis]|uniref:DUF4132 domain-containing protein n=1 Tax=Actinomadura darangshiensis TaxID=705336 RepID=A0A4R5AWA6_9ACTN|nr:DUF4132 domain-containing protein [Actinomadura darangshiensis]TDD77738.1 DUF4132 domain-containing protein [Actinomadura darangshiensis]